MIFGKKGLFRFSCVIVLFLAGCFTTAWLVNPSPNIAVFSITGKTSTEEVEWKNPYSPYTKATLPTYEITIDFFEKETFQEFFFGDVLGIRFKILELYPLLHWVGFKDRVIIDCLSSDYDNLDKKRNFPSKTISLQKENLVFWPSIFYEKFSFFWIKKASLKMEFFPLVDSKGKPAKKQSFLITYGSGSVEIKSMD